MIQRSAEVLPENGVLAGEVGGEQQGEHVDCATRAGGANQDAGHQAEADGQLTVSNDEGDRGGMRKYEVPQHRRHEWIGATSEESLDPPLKPAAKNKFRPENLVLAENKKKNADSYAESGENFRISIRGYRLYQAVQRADSNIPRLARQFKIFRAR